MVRYRQRGEDSTFPSHITTWTLGEDVPEWLSDIAKIAAIDSNTSKISLEIRETNTGGYELLDSSGQRTLIKFGSKTDVLCKGLDLKGQMFIMSPLQLNLVYERYGQLQ